MIIGSGSGNDSMGENEQLLMEIEELKKLVVFLVNKTNIDGIVIEFLLNKIASLSNVSVEDVSTELEQYVKNRIEEIQKNQPKLVIPL